jgi:hypothetical protein
MAHEIDAAALESVQAATARAPSHARPIGAPCPNCETPLAGPWCHACGQSSEDFHRSIRKLAVEAFGGLIDIDGRVWRTLPDLCLRPGKLTRRYLDGHRMPQIPPFRLFLIVIVLVFLVAGLQPHDKNSVTINSNGGVVKANTTNFKIVPVGGDAAAAWVSARLNQAAKNPDAFEATLAEWAQRLAVLALPISAAMLGLTFFWRRGVYMFDHLIFSMHSLSFQALLLSVAMLSSMLSDWLGWLLLAAPAHLFVHLRGVYGVGIFGALWRMTVLFIGTVIAFFLALSALVMIGLATVGG